MSKTVTQFDTIIAEAKDIFVKKTKDYGTAWRILRPSSLTDQILIKAKRIRSIEENEEQKVADSIEEDYIGLINYGVMAIIQLHLSSDDMELKPLYAEELYTKYLSETRELMIRKNHDYGEVWREMRVSSITDLILQKLIRVKKIEDNKGKTVVSEGLEANYQDIINYAVFALIKLGEQKGTL